MFDSVLNLRSLVIVVILISSANIGAEIPQVASVNQTSKAILGEPFEVIYNIQWTGNHDSVSILPPDPVVLTWGDVTIGKSETYTNQGIHHLAQSILIDLNEVGQFDFPEMAFNYATPEIRKNKADTSDSEEEAPPVVYPTILAASFPVSVLKPTDPLTYVIGIVIAVCTLTGGFLLFRRRQLSALNPAIGTAQLTVIDTLHDARKQRLDQNHYAFFTALSRGAKLLDNTPENRALKSRYELKMQEVGFKGYTPTEDELDGALRELERANKK